MVTDSFLQTLNRIYIPHLIGKLIERKIPHLTVWEIIQQRNVPVNQSPTQIKRHHYVRRWPIWHPFFNNELLNTNWHTSESKLLEFKINVGSWQGHSFKQKRIGVSGSTSTGLYCTDSWTPDNISHFVICVKYS